MDSIANSEVLPFFLSILAYGGSLLGSGTGAGAEAETGGSVVLYCAAGGFSSG